MEETYEKAFVEVLAIIKNLPKKEYEKIPKEKIEILEKHSDKSYEFNININVPLESQNISKKANAILVTLYRDYFATDSQKEKLKEILKNNWLQEEERKQKEYNPNNIFYKKELKAETECTELIEYKQNFFQKLVNKIIKFFKKTDK